MTKHIINKFFQKPLILVLIVGVVNFSYSEDWGHIKLQHFQVIESNFKGALNELSLALSKKTPEPVELSYASVGPSVSYKESGVSQKHRSLADELIGRALRTICKSEQNFEKNNSTQITISLHGKTGNEILEILSSYLGADSFQISGNTILLNRDHTIHITAVEISENLASLLRRKEVVVELPFQPGMFEVSPHSNAILIASLSPIGDSELHRLRELEKSL